MSRVALTTDIGEGFGHWRLADDDALLAIVTSANIACGFHGGDPRTMRETCETAVRRGVAIGAQVSYRDLHGFGRRYIAASREELTGDLIYQLGALHAFARIAGGKIDYVRAHGALYNTAARDAEHAQAIVDAVAAFDNTLPLLCQLRTQQCSRAQAAGLRVIAEGFVDRAYTPEGLLVPRTQPDAMITDPALAAARAVAMATGQTITAYNGSRISVHAQALLVHCDTAGSVQIARAVRAALEAAEVELCPIS